MVTKRGSMPIPRDDQKLIQSDFEFLSSLSLPLRYLQSRDGPFLSFEEPPISEDHAASSAG